MSSTIRIPTTLRALTAGQSTVEVAGATVAEILANLETAHPGFKEQLLDDDGSLRRFVNVFVSDDDIRFMQGLDTPVEAGSVGVDRAGGGRRQRQSQQLAASPQAACGRGKRWGQAGGVANWRPGVVKNRRFLLRM